MNSKIGALYNINQVVELAMNPPPEKIDGARVIAWAGSDDGPFGVLEREDGKAGPKIFGFALCQSEGEARIYRFSCDENWETQQDDDYASIEEAKRHLPEQYQRLEPQWHRRD